jgi:hypothetical protein
MWATRYESCGMASRPLASTSMRRGNSALSTAPQALHLRFPRGHRQLLARPYRRRRPAILRSTSAIRQTITCWPSTSNPRESRPDLDGLTSTQHHAPPSSCSIRLPLAPIRPNGPHARMATRARHQLPHHGASAIFRRMGHGLGAEGICPTSTRATSVRADLADKPGRKRVARSRSQSPPASQQMSDIPTPTHPHTHRHNPGTFAPNTADGAINLHFQHITRVPSGRTRQESKLSQVSHPGRASGQLPSRHSPTCYRNMDEAYPFSPIGPDSSYPRSQPQSMAGCPITLQLTAGGSALPRESCWYVNHPRQ